MEASVGISGIMRLSQGGLSIPTSRKVSALRLYEAARDCLNRQFLLRRPRTPLSGRMGLHRMISCLRSRRGNKSLRLASLVTAPHTAINFPSALVNLGERRGQTLSRPLHSPKLDLLSLTGPYRAPPAWRSLRVSPQGAGFAAGPTACWRVTTLTSVSLRPMA